MVGRAVGHFSIQQGALRPAGPQKRKNAVGSHCLASILGWPPARIVECRPKRSPNRPLRRRAVRAGAFPFQCGCGNCHRDGLPMLNQSSRAQASQAKTV